MISPSGRREALDILICRGLSQRKACGYLGFSRRIATYALRQPDKDKIMGEQLMAASQQVPRFGYRRMAAWLQVSDSKLRDELLNREWFRSRAEAKVLIEQWRQFYNEQRPHSAHRYQPPASVRRNWLETCKLDKRLTG